MVPRRGGRSVNWSTPTTPGIYSRTKKTIWMRPAQTILLEPEEADQLAEILHTQLITDRVLEFGSSGGSAN